MVSSNTNALNFVGNGITSSYVSGKVVVDVDFTKLNAATASLQSQLTAIGGQSGSWITESETGSFATTASFNAYTASTNSDLASIHSTTASLQAQLATIGTQSGSWGGGSTDLTQLNQATASLQQATASLQSFTASADQRLDSIEAVSGSWITESETGSFAILGANQIFTGNNTITGNTVVSQSAHFGTASFYAPMVISNGIASDVDVTGSLVATKVGAYDFDNLYYGSQLGLSLIHI